VSAPVELFPDLPTLPVDMTWFSFEEALAPYAEEAVRAIERRRPGAVRLDDVFKQPYGEE
jgi:hypothetical protein